MNTYTARISREGGDWLADGIEYPEAIDYGPSLDKIRTGMADAFILAADLPDNTEVEVRLIPADTLTPEDAQAVRVNQRRHDLEAEAERLRADTLTLVRQLHARGDTTRTIGAAVGLTAGRVHQLLHAG